MTNMMGPVEILKTDGAGRVRTPKERRQTLLAEFESSGLSGVRFADLAGLTNIRHLPGGSHAENGSAVTRVPDQSVNQDAGWKP